ncbi:MAG: hypothetical protein DRK00_02935 [Thermoprotei archaeon]|nr:MAG: hypothetical protein DRK00_02935 [Thermoprotei archaeon]
MRIRSAYSFSLRLGAILIGGASNPCGVSVWVSLISCCPPYATMSRARTCIYYKHTSNGTRCVLLSPEEWRLRGYTLKDYCLRGGNGCPVLARVLSSSPDCDFLSSIVKRGGLERGA